MRESERESKRERQIGEAERKRDRKRNRKRETIAYVDCQQQRLDTRQGDPNSDALETNKNSTSTKKARKPKEGKERRKEGGRKAGPDGSQLFIVFCSR